MGVYEVFWIGGWEFFGKFSNVEGIMYEEKFLWFKLICYFVICILILNENVMLVLVFECLC